MSRKVGEVEAWRVGELESRRRRRRRCRRRATVRRSSAPFFGLRSGVVAVLVIVSCWVRLEVVVLDVEYFGFAWRGLRACSSSAYSDVDRGTWYVPFTSFSTSFRVLSFFGPHCRSTFFVLHFSSLLI